MSDLGADSRSNDQRSGGFDIRVGDDAVQSVGVSGPEVVRMRHAPRAATLPGRRRQAGRTPLESPAPRIFDGFPAGRPHVFGVEASARLLSEDGSATLESEVAVALLMTPVAGEEFVVRVPRGTFGSGALFVLSCPGLARGALARTTFVAELVGVHYDLVTALMVHPAGDARAEPQRTPRRDGQTARTDAIAKTKPPRTVAADLDTDARSLELMTNAQGPELRQRASASAVEIDGVATITAELSMTLLAPLQMGEPVKLSVSRGEITRGVYFALRYFDMSGAKRALVRADALRPLPGMLDEVEGVLIRVPTRAEERQSYRAPFERFFIAEVLTRGARSMRGRITDLSAGGIGFCSPSKLEGGDWLRITDPSLPEIDGAELVVVRSGPRDAQRYGARFAESNRGAIALSTILGLNRSERERRRRLQAEAIRRSNKATAAPLSTTDTQALRNQRMGTRKHTK
jgi:hypothetical protein